MQAMKMSPPVRAGSPSPAGPEASPVPSAKPIDPDIFLTPPGVLASDPVTALPALSDLTGGNLFSASGDHAASDGDTSPLRGSWPPASPSGTPPRPSGAPGQSVKVAVNIRPLLPLESNAGCKECVVAAANEPQVQLPGRAFTFDHVYGGGGALASGIFDECVAPLVEGLFLGYNATVLAYGQTGSGKTYTMGTGFDGGGALDPGITPRVLDTLFRRADEIRGRGSNVQIRVSLIEVR
eukprot:jgi/Mesen1/5678/ME000288S04882